MTLANKILEAYKIIGKSVVEAKSKANLKEVPNLPDVKTMVMFLKVADMFNGTFLDAKGDEVFEYSGYVPDFFPEEHYGDYVNLDIELSTGKITNWKKVQQKDVVKLKMADDDRKKNRNSAYGKNESNDQEEKNKLKVQINWHNTAIKGCEQLLKSANQMIVDAGRQSDSELAKEAKEEADLMKDKIKSHKDSVSSLEKQLDESENPLNSENDCTCATQECDCKPKIVESKGLAEQLLEAHRKIPEAKLTKKKASDIVGKFYSKHGNGVQVSIMDLGNITDPAEEHLLQGGTPEEAEEMVTQAINKYRKN